MRPTRAIACNHETTLHTHTRTHTHAHAHAHAHTHTHTLASFILHSCKLHFPCIHAKCTFRAVSCNKPPDVCIFNLTHAITCINATALHTHTHTHTHNTKSTHTHLHLLSCKVHFPCSVMQRTSRRLHINSNTRNHLHSCNRATHTHTHNPPPLQTQNQTCTC